MTVDRTCHHNVRASEIVAGSGKGGGITEGNGHVGREGAGPLPCRGVQSGSQVRRAACSKVGHRGQETGGVGGLQVDIEAGGVREGRAVGRSDCIGVSNDPIREGQIRGVDASGGVAVDIDRDRLRGGRRDRGSRGQGVATALCGTDIGSGKAQARCVCGGSGAQRGRGNGSHRVGSVRSVEDECRDTIIGNGDREVGRASGDDRIGSRKDITDRTEWIGGRLNVDGVRSIDERVARGYIVGGIKCSGVAGRRGQEGVGRGCERR